MLGIKKDKGLLIVGKLFIYTRRQLAIDLRYVATKARSKGYVEGMVVGTMITAGAAVAHCKYKRNKEENFTKIS